ncbi:MAG: hypothetical protein H7175_11325 [Burkholderiales bacterium]|nr:hypothetical protein [Anaerolineae bacterium]
MPYNLKWGNDEQTLLYLTLEGALSWEQLYESMQGMKDWADSVSHPIVTITDVTRADKLPLSNVLKLKPAFAIKSENTRLAIIVGMPSFQQTMVNLFMSLYKQLAGEVPVAFVETIEKAEALAARELVK